MRDEDDGEDGGLFEAILCAGGALALLAPPAIRYTTSGWQFSSAREYTGKAKAKADLGTAERHEVDTAFDLAKRRLLAASRACVQYVLLQLYRGASAEGSRVRARLDDLRREVRADVVEFLADPALKGHTNDNDLRAALFPGKGMISKASGLQEFDDPGSKVVARNWNKGQGFLHKVGYEVCLQSKYSNELNEVEMVVAVLLHEVAHTIHKEHVGESAHGPDFDAINNFLVGLARCEIARAPPAEKQRWRAPDNSSSRWMAIKNADDPSGPGLRAFDVDKFSTACSQGGSKSKGDWPHFCGIKAPIGACGGQCK